MNTTISADQLYKPDKYNVHLGEGNIGFCTVWNEPEAVLKQAPELHEKAAIVGTLYSRQGVNIILRNLALNPDVHTLYVWGNGPLSNTKFGVMGLEVLRMLWDGSITDDGEVEGTGFRLEEEIDISVLRTIIKHVKIVDVSDKSIQEAVATVDGKKKESYMKSVRFPDAVVREPDTWPSEKVGWVIRGRGIIDVWTRVVERIMRYGIVKGTQYGSQQKELIGVTWVVHGEDPANPVLPDDWPKELCDLTGATQEAITQYHDVFLSPEMPKGVSYTYGNRLMRYPVPATSDDSSASLDQITEGIIRNLKASPDTRRAVATTIVPWVDAISDEPPCITQIQAIQADGELHFLVTVRSHDIFKAAIPNAFGLRMLQQRIASETGFQAGALQITSQSAHIYESDWDNAKKLASCSFWEGPVKKLAAEDADPRGRFLIRVQNGAIHVDFQGATGEELFHFEGTNADRLVLEISKHELMSQTGHALDIGIQLARAEAALKVGIPFTQDQPLNFTHKTSKQ